MPSEDYYKEAHLLMEDQRTERVEKLKYLVFTVSSKWDCNELMKIRISCVWKCMRAFIVSLLIGKNK